MSKIWAIMGGGDWADASVEFVVLDGQIEGQIEELIASWKKYEQRRYDIVMINLIDGTTHKIPDWIPLDKWLIDAGARRPTGDELEEHWDE